MNYNLKEIFKGITPDNIKDIPVIRDSMHIFMEVLEERAKQSIDINSYTENKKVRKELFKTYLGDLYEVLDGIKDNQKLIDLIASRNSIYSGMDDYEFISREVLEDMLSRISDEHFMAFRNFREKKGTIKSIEYIFQLIATLVNSPEGVDYIIIEGKNPFELGIEGTLPPEFYYYLIAPLAHPAGFTFAYAQAVAWELVDYFFPIEKVYTVRQLDINCVSVDPSNPNSNIKTTTDFSSRKVIDIVKNSYIWPRSLKIYFGGEHEGEYLENLTYANGHSTVELKDANNKTILAFGDYCTIADIIEVEIIQNSELDDMMTEIHYSLRTSYNTIWNPETRELEEFEDTVVKDEFGTVMDQASEDNPFMSWEKTDFWSVIGPNNRKWDNWSGVCYPDSIMETSISQGDELPFMEKITGSGRGLIKQYQNYPSTKIGDSGMFIWGKIEQTQNQIGSEIISDDIPERYNPYESEFSSNIIPNKETVLYGLMDFNDKEVLVINPTAPNLKHARMSGDSYNLNYITRTKKIDEFIVRDSLSAYIVPDSFELENDPYFCSILPDEMEIGDNDITIRVNSFIIRDDVYSFVFFNDKNFSDRGNSQSNGRRVPGCNNELGYDNLKKGFWNNGFHSESEKFEFGVFRNGQWVPDNNVNKPTILDIFDDYELSYEKGFNFDGEADFGYYNYIQETAGVSKVFDMHSDIISKIEDISSIDDDYEKSFDTVSNKVITSFDMHSDVISKIEDISSIDDDYEKSFDTVTNKIIIGFDKHSDKFLTDIITEIDFDDYDISYEKGFVFGEDAEVIRDEYFLEWPTYIKEFTQNSDSLHTEMDISEKLDDYEKSFDTTLNKEIIVFNEYSDIISNIDLLMNIDEDEYGKSFSVITNKEIIVFDENSDIMITSINTELENNYELSFEEMHTIGRRYLDTIGSTIIGQELNEIIEIFDEDSDGTVIIKD